MWAGSRELWGWLPMTRCRGQGVQGEAGDQATSHLSPFMVAVQEMRLRHRQDSELVTSLEIGAGGSLGRRMFSSWAAQSMYEQIKRLQIKLQKILCMSVLHGWTIILWFIASVLLSIGKNRKSAAFTGSLGKVIRGLISTYDSSL